ncbi:hypothetical protein Bca4012_044797 [Brassica carinata]|uniref:Uncharacterized protein n=1 Tax=Brassica carinata TaxID=52824 RepID=A0A8X7QWK9_BRACI|nr:hypothetical protein Bca52824_057718 [Brassica carinata]
MSDGQRLGTRRQVLSAMVRTSSKKKTVTIDEVFPDPVPNSMEEDRDSEVVADSEDEEQQPQNDMQEQLEPDGLPKKPAETGSAKYSLTKDMGRFWTQLSAGQLCLCHQAEGVCGDLSNLGDSSSNDEGGAEDLDSLSDEF